jgi:hypothetical protein
VLGTIKDQLIGWTICRAIDQGNSFVGFEVTRQSEDGKTLKKNVWVHSARGCHKSGRLSVNTARVYDADGKEIERNEEAA